MRGTIWALITAGFVLLIAGGFVAADVQKIVGIVLVCASGVFFFIARGMSESQRRGQ